MLLGAHVSVAGGLENGPVEGRSIGADVIQVFTRNQRQWAAKPVTDEEAVTFRDSLAKQSIGAVMSHASYLLNLCAPDPAARRKSAAAFKAEIERCAKLGVTLVNFHPGAHLGSGEAAAIAAGAEVLREAIEETPDATHVKLVLENTAGQGSCVGHRFEHLGEFLEKVGYLERIGICLDTQHSFAAGYDLKSEAGYADVFAEFDAKVGLQHLVAFHLNDSKVAHGGRVDRHECLGKGTLGFELFARLMNDPRFAALPGFLETPAGVAGWKREIEQLRAAVMVAPASAAVTRAPKAARAGGAPAPRSGSRRAKGA
ncbi:MAG: deoxyribonuclease IV [Planctomycetes bacterium]|nr:deoxyribonuclease IV [Planctomycetota bacterium]